MKTNYTVSLVIVFLGWMPLWAQENNLPANDTVIIDEVVVTGTKAAVSRNQVPLTVSVINQKQIESQAESALLPVLSNVVPGLYVTERGVTGFGVSTGSGGQITIRGIGGFPNTEVLVLLNGSPQYMGLMGHPLPDAYRSSNIERVEVIRGPASALYGSNAMGGVINIITKEQKNDGVSANANILYGSYQTFKASAGAGFRRNGFNLYTGINHDQSDGHREASYFDITDGYIKTGYKFNDHFNTSGDLSLARFHAADPGVDTSDIVVHGDTIDIFRGMGSVVFNNQFDKMNGSFRAFYNFGEHTMKQGFHSTDFNRGMMFYENFMLMKANTITIGVDYKSYGGFAENTVYHKKLGDTSMFELAGYLLIQQQILEKLTLNGGLRSEWHETCGNQLLPSIGGAYRLSENTVFKASASKGFRNPTIRELYLIIPGMPKPNKDLKPEKSFNYEFSVEQHLLKHKLVAEATLFYIHATDMIQSGLNNQGVRTYFNTDKVTNTGLELSTRANPMKDLWLHANYSYIHMDEPVTAAPTHKFYISGNYQYWKLDATLSYQYINKLYTEIGETEKTESFGLLDAQVSISIIKGLRIYTKVQNLTNETYQVNFGYPMPGRCWFGGISYSFD
jgi:outer membrane receptor protein involved in Fe transport